MASWEIIAKGGAWTAALSALTGERPGLEYRGDQALITLTPGQIEWMRGYIEQGLSITPKGERDVVITNLQDVWLPIAARKVLPIGIGLLVVGVILGRVSK